MAILNILKNNEPELKKTARPVETINNRILTLLGDMRDTLKEANGIGLAAPQVGVLRRVVIIETPDGELLEMINPEITARDGEQQEVEGCLSFPDTYAITRRPLNCTVRFTDRNGDVQERSGSEILARAFCHEVDHLNGIVCYDDTNCVRMLTDEEVEEMRNEKKKK